jgi:hypothetical protein
MTTFLVFLSAGAVSATVMLWVENCSPRGYADAHGFHFGDEPRLAR